MRTGLASAARIPHATGSWLLALAVGCALPACGPAAGTERPSTSIVACVALPADRLGTVDGVPVREGGYSGLAFDEAGGLWALTDRGPNLEAERAAGRPAKRFPVPDYHPHAQRLTLDSAGVTLSDVLAFGTATGDLATGYPPPATDPALTVELALDADFRDDGHDAEGIDSEGIAFGGGSLWVGDEYRPSVWRLDPQTGRLLARYTPTPSHPLDRPLPTWLLQRRPNLGFEGLAWRNDYLFAALQGPLSPPGGDAYTPLTRILRLDPATGDARAFAYALEGPARKIGDLAVHPDGRLLVLEHGERPGGRWSAEVYAVDLARVGYLAADALPPERFRDLASALAAGVAVAPKTLHVDLLAAGYPPRLRKPEGLAVDPAGRLVVINDNDFGLDSPRGTGSAVATGVATELFVID